MHCTGLVEGRKPLQNNTITPKHDKNMTLLIGLPSNTTSKHLLAAKTGKYLQGFVCIEVASSLHSGALMAILAFSARAEDLGIFCQEY